MAIKRTSNFDTTVDLEAIEAQIPRDAQGNPTDEIEAPAAGTFAQGAIFDVKPQHTPSLGTVLSALGEDENSVRNHDPRALENFSTAPCIESPVLLTETQTAHIEGASAVQATLENTKGMNVAKVPLETRRQLAQISEVMKNLPTADAITYVDNRKIYMASEVRDVPNRLSKGQAMRAYEVIFGTALTAKVVKCAMGAGFVAKPHVWLSQRLAFEASKREIWDKITPLPSYEEETEIENRTDLPKAISALFSATVTEQLMVISKISRISMLHAIKIMVDRVCECAIEEKRPKEYVEKFESMPELDALIAAG